MIKCPYCIQGINEDADSSKFSWRFLGIKVTGVYTINGRRMEKVINEANCCPWCGRKLTTDINKAAK